MPQTSPAQRAEAADILRQLQTGAALWGSPDGARARLLELLPALLADAGALAERERADEVRRAGPLSRVPVTIRGGGPARAIRYDKGVLTDDDWDEMTESADTRRLRSQRRHTLHDDDAGQVVSGAPDFEGDDARD